MVWTEIVFIVERSGHRPSLGASAREGVWALQPGTIMCILIFSIPSGGRTERIAVDIKQRTFYQINVLRDFKFIDFRADESCQIYLR